MKIETKRTPVVAGSSSLEAAPPALGPALSSWFLVVENSGFSR